MYYKYLKSDKSKFFLWHLERPQLFSFFIVGVLGSGIGTVCFTWAFQFIGPTKVILLQKLQPLFAILLSTYVFKTSINSKFIFWAIICLLGGMMVSFPHINLLQDSLSIDYQEFFQTNSLKGLLLTLIAVLSWGAATVYGKKLMNEGIAEFEIMLGRFFFGVIGLLPFIISLNWYNFMGSAASRLWPWQYYAPLFVMVFLSGFLGMAFYYHGVRYLSAKACALFEMFFPFFAVIVNWVFLNDQITISQIIGAIALLLGSAMIQIKHYDTNKD